MSFDGFYKNKRNKRDLKQVMDRQTKLENSDLMEVGKDRLHHWLSVGR